MCGSAEFYHTHFLRAMIYLNIFGPRIACVCVDRMSACTRTPLCAVISHHIRACVVCGPRSAVSVHTPACSDLIIFGPVLCAGPRNAVSVLTRFAVQQLCVHTVLHAAF